MSKKMRKIFYWIAVVVGIITAAVLIYGIITSLI